MERESAPDAAKKGVKTFECPACGGVVTLRAAGQSLLAVCSHCSSVIDVANENYQIIQKASEKGKETLLPVGARGILFDTVWEVIGYTLKCDSTGEYVWDEYLLFNPYSGYRFLVQAQGHWNFITMIKEEIPSKSLEAREIWVGDRKYRLFLKDTSRVLYVKGEFYWRVRRGERVKETDYVSPPYLLVVEDSGSDEIVSRGIYVEPGVIQKAFGIGMFRMPGKKGVAANQPSPYQETIWKICGAFIAALIAAFLVHALAAGKADKEVLYSSTYMYPEAQKDLTFSSPVFTISKKSNILINTASPVDNDWTEVRYSVVKDDGNAPPMPLYASSQGGSFPASPAPPPAAGPQRIYEMLASVEYYHGHDSDGYWHEGGQARSDYIASAAPPGKYRLLYEVDTGAFSRLGNAGQVQMSFAVIRDVPSTGNFLWTVLLLLFYPALALLRHFRFESARWSQSDYNPYSTEEA